MKSQQNKHGRLASIAGSKPVLAVGALALTYLAGGLFIVPALLKWQLPEQAQSRLGATLSLGHVYFNPLTLTLEMGDVSLRTVREGTLLAADKLRADFEFSSLFRRAWTFTDIQLEQPSLRIEFDKDGGLNLQPLLAALKRPDAKPEQAPARLLVRHLGVKNGRVDVADQRLEQQLIARINPITLEATDIGTLAPDSGNWQLSARSEAGEVLRAGGTLGLQPFSLNGNLDLAGLQAGTLARGLHTRLRLSDVAGTLGLSGKYSAAIKDGALHAALEQLELTLAGFAATAQGRAIALESGRLALPRAQWSPGTNGMQLILTGPALTLGAASLSSGADRLQLPEASLGMRQLLASVGDATALTLDDTALALPRLQWKQAGGDIDAAAPSLKLDRLALRMSAGALEAQAEGAALSLASLAQRAAGQAVRTGAVSLTSRQIRSGRKQGDKAVLSAQMLATRLEAAGVAVGAAGRQGALYSLAQGSSAADTLTLSLPASGPDVSADGLSASLKKLVVNEARQAGELAHADDVQLKGAKVRLGERRLDLGSLALAGGAAQVRFDKDGSLNWTGPATSAPATDPARQPDQKSAARSAKSTKPVKPVERARPARPGNAPAATPWRVTASKLALRDFSLAYADARQEPPLAFKVDDIAATMSEFDTGAPGPARLQLSGRSGGGTLQAEGSISLSSGAGDLGIRAAGLPLAMLQPYLTEAARLTLTGGTLSGAGRLRFGDAQGPKLAYTGTASLDKVAIEETAPRRHFMSWDAVAASDMRLTLSPNRLDIGQLRIAGPVAELIIAEDQSVNLARVFKRKPEAGGQAAAAKGGNAPAAPGQEGDAFPVSIARLRVERGVLTFADFSQQPQFSTRMHHLQGVMTGLSSAPGSRARLQFNAAIADYGDARIEGSMNPFKPAYATDVRMNFRNVDLSALTPYVVRFAGYRVSAGTLSMDLRYQVKESRLVGDNRFVLNKVQLGEKVDSPTAMDLPLKLALSLLEDENGIINIGVPVTGDLQNPQFSFGAVARRAIGNVLRSVVTAPFRALASLFGGSGEKLDTIAFDAGSAELAPPEQEKLAKLGQGLAKRPNVRLVVHPAVDAGQDAQALRSVEARRVLLARMGVRLAPGEDPGPIDTASVAAQKAIAAMYAERYPGPLPKPPADQAADAWYGQLLDKVIAAQPLPEDALARLSQARGAAVRQQLEQAALPAQRVALGNADESASDGTATRLELAPL
ncbi:DUF748 domain-containing protein [Noviherbaspirillum soli]|uniref:DUF748 domain-containing protein n=1 Tax=Noviherbaspirillum soli TaxID=1064518 RepID=UPI00188ABBBA|nr:DUF748 domain-containing protein [Noviherbaspirillum soli]